MSTWRASSPPLRLEPADDCCTINDDVKRYRNEWPDDHRTFGPKEANPAGASAMNFGRVACAWIFAWCMYNIIYVYVYFCMEKRSATMNARRNDNSFLKKEINRSETDRYSIVMHVLETWTRGVCAHIFVHVIIICEHNARATFRTLVVVKYIIRFTIMLSWRYFFIDVFHSFFNLYFFRQVFKRNRIMCEWTLVFIITRAFQHASPSHEPNRTRWTPSSL